MKQCNTPQTQIGRAAVDDDNRSSYQFQFWDKYIILPAMGTRDKDKSRALTAKTTNFLMIDLDKFLKKPWIPSDENIIYSSIW